MTMFMYFDAPTLYQINLQDSATYGMEMIIQLHNYVMFLNVFIISVVIWFFFEIITVIFFLKDMDNSISTFIAYKQLKRAMNHMAILEIVWTLLPVLALISIALPSLSMLYYFSLSFSPEIIVQVVGHQWYWTYEFYMADPFTWRGLGPLDLLVKFLDHQVTLEGRIVPLEAWAFADTLIYESIMLQAEDLSFGSFRLLEVDVPLYLPIDVSIRVVVSSDDVLHSWAVPSLGIKIDSVPGRLNVVEFRIARSGIYYGQCSEICGTQHGFMPICIVAVSKALFTLIYF